MEGYGIIVAFYAFSAITIVSALAVFVLRNLVHAIVFLVLSFLGMAGLFFELGKFEPALASERLHRCYLATIKLNKKWSTKLCQVVGVV